LQSESDYGLGLTVKEDSNGRNSDHAYIDSVAGMRHSRVFQGRWWDILEFNLHLKSDDTGKKVFISGTANVIVSEVNAPNLVAFHGLDDRQRQEYAKRLSDEVTKAIQMTCKHFNQLDATTIECN
jgi:predicted alpha/beta-fold hydrolase